MQLNRKRRRAVPELTTSALPDLIFSILFFFMIVTHLRQTDVNFSVQTPQGSELTKLRQKYAVTRLVAGLTDKHELILQLDNKLITLDQLANVISAKRNRLPEEEQQLMTVSLKADKRLPLRYISEIKEELRKAQVLRISYSATEIIKKP